MSTDKNARGWVAGLQERRMAWSVSAVCIGLIVIALIWPGLFSSDMSAPDKTEDQQAASASSETYHLPQKAVPAKKPDPGMTPEPTHPVQRSENSVAKTQAATTTSRKSFPPAIKPWAGGYYVQLGAFRDRSRAKSLADRVHKAGWSAHIEPRSNNMHAVWTGPMTSRDQAKQTLQKIDKSMHIKGFIVRKQASGK
ncbi:MAG: SPOR domain-containing protein [Mariprofundaceae bacterium]